MWGGDDMFKIWLWITIAQWIILYFVVRALYKEE
jgi:hypothetical protein